MPLLWVSEVKRMRVLVVDDETRLAQNIAGGLREGPGYAVDLAHNGPDALHLCRAAEYDLIVLDLMLPGLSGEDLLRTLRAERRSTPVLVLTAVAETQRTIHLLELGADDYLTKPFDLGELLARARALIRRGKGGGEPLLRFGELEVHTVEQRVTHAGTAIDLSRTEYRILEYLMHRPRAIVSRRELLEHLYDFTWEHHSNVVEAHISNLRRKLRAATGAELLENLRGRGYRLLSLS